MGSANGTNLHMLVYGSPELIPGRATPASSGSCGATIPTSP